jgi:hypothetical protein
MKIYIEALVLTSALNLFALSRMLFFRMQKKLFFLIAFLMFQLAQSVAVIFLTRSVQSTAYQELYEVTEPLNWILYILVVREMYGRAFAGYPGISSLARWAAYASAALAVILCVGLAIVSPIQNWPHQQIFASIAIWEKFVSFALAAFIALMVFIVSRYPIGLDFNMVSSITIFAIYFFGSFIFLQIGAIGSSGAIEFQTAGLFVLSSICFASWGLCLRRPAQVPSVRARIGSKPLEEQRLLEQLAFLNNMLVKSARE